MLALNQEDQGQLDRLATRDLVCYLYANMGVSLALKDGRIAATPKQPPLSKEARTLLKEHKEALLSYLTTPPVELRPCAACGRVGQWVLDWMAIWVCDCYYHQELWLNQEGAKVVTQDAPLRAVTQTPARTQETFRLPHEDDMTAIGVLTADMLYVWKPGTPSIDRLPITLDSVDLEKLYQIGCQHRLHDLWLCPGSQWSMHFYQHPENFAPAHLSEHYKISVKRRDKDQVPCSGTICARNGARGYRPFLRVFLPDHDSTWLEDLDNVDRSWSLSDVEDPIQFLGTLVLIYQKLGIYLATSPAKTGIDSMQLHTNASEWAHTEQEIHLPHFAEKDMQWKRALTANEQGLYLHKFDRNSMYLAATTGADMGIGTPEHRDAQEAASAFLEGLMGMWEVTVREPTQFSQETALLPHKDIWTGKQWLTSPGLKALIGLGYEYEIHQGYVWFNEKRRTNIGKRRALKEWASYLFKVRQELKAKYGKEHPAYRLIKMIGLRSLGWLDLTSVSERIRAGEEVKDIPWYYKPYFYQEIKGLARLRMVLKMQELGNAGAFPVLVYTDCFACLSPEAVPRKAFPKLLERENELGGFKHAGTHLVNSRVIEAFQNDQPANITLQLLKTIEMEG